MAEVSAIPYISVITTSIMWFGLIIMICLLKNFFVQGVSLAVAEWLLRLSSPEHQQKVCRWLANGDEVMAYLQALSEKENKKS